MKTKKEKELFERFDFQFDKELFFCKWEDSCGLYTEEEMTILMKRADQEEELDRNYKGIGWLVVDPSYMGGEYTFENLGQVIDFMKDEESSAVGFCHNMTIIRVN